MYTEINFYKVTMGYQEGDRHLLSGGGSFGRGVGGNATTEDEVQNKDDLEKLISVISYKLYLKYICLYDIIVYI